MSTTPEFRIIPKKEATARRKPRRKVRTSWSALVLQIADTVNTGKAVFVSDEQVSDADVKYLTLALKRRGNNEMLRTQREAVDGVEGRMLWCEIA